MTNEQIIMGESLKLMDEGILKSSGEIAMTLDGRTVELPEPIHTFNGWQERGYKVKKGEKSTIKFPIWKFVKKKDDENEDKKEKCFLKMSAFFTLSQVERVTQ